MFLELILNPAAQLEPFSVLSDNIPLLDDEVDVPQSHILDLWLPGEQGDQWGR